MTDFKLNNDPSPVTCTGDCAVKGRGRVVLHPFLEQTELGGSESSVVLPR